MDGRKAVAFAGGGTTTGGTEDRENKDDKLFVNNITIFASRSPDHGPLVRLLSLARAAIELAEAVSLTICRSNSRPKLPTKNRLLTPSDLI